MVDQLKDLGYHFIWDIADSRNFLLPQRRNRAWGLATIISQADASRSELMQRFKDALQMMRSNVQFPVSLMFPVPKDFVEEEPKNERHAVHVLRAQEKYFHSTNVFVDCAGSLRSSTCALGAVPCITPQHPVYYCHQKRYLGPTDYLNAQGLWPGTWSKEMYKKLLESPKLAQCFAGNSFSSTVNQAVFLSALVACNGAWDSMIASQKKSSSKRSKTFLKEPRMMKDTGASASSGSGGPLLLRCRQKRKAPEFDHLVPARADEKKKKERKCKNHWKRKVPGKDSRKFSNGKKVVASIWDKEQVIRPQFSSMNTTAHTHTYIYIYIYF
jgi:hypothetical protein